MENPKEAAKTQKPAEQRRMLRYPIIILKVSEEGRKEHLFGYAKNISRGGLFIQSVNPREVGERFTISFQIQDTEIRVRSQCEVVWARRYQRKSPYESGYGIRFLDLSPGVGDAIEAWIKKQK